MMMMMMIMMMTVTLVYIHYWCFSRLWTLPLFWCYTSSPVQMPVNRC